PGPLPSSAEVTVTDKNQKFHIKISILYTELSIDFLGIPISATGDARNNTAHKIYKRSNSL
ncbi:hypothetical protein, partial [Pseudomonas veronii]|uniref:hypothetical protein n=1 Tax=Pseudomonas veronii TaxID=76761 RepID=UPI001E45B669